MSSSHFAGRSVLVIEDEPFTRKVLAKMLSNLGFAAVYQAGDGHAGLEAVHAHVPDVVVCDVEMLPMDGLEFLRSLREEGHALIPVAFMTNRADETRIAEARALGSDAFLVKPASPDTLRQCLGKLLA